MCAGPEGGGADIMLTGLRNAKDFRKEIMRAKDMRESTIGWVDYFSSRIDLPVSAS